MAGTFFLAQTRTDVKSLLLIRTLSEAERVVTPEAETEVIRVKSHASMTYPCVVEGEILASCWMRDLEQAKQQRLWIGSYIQLRSWHLVHCS